MYAVYLPLFSYAVRFLAVVRTTSNCILINIGNWSYIHYSIDDWFFHCSFVHLLFPWVFRPICLYQLFIHPLFLHSFLVSFILSFTNSYNHLSVHCMRSDFFIFSFICSFNTSFDNSFIHSFNLSPDNFSICSWYNCYFYSFVICQFIIFYISG